MNKPIKSNKSPFVFHTEDCDSYFKIEIDGNTFLFNSEIPEIGNWIRGKCSNNNIHEPVMSKLICDYLTRNKKATFFDIGSYLGFFSLLGLSCSKNAKVLAFEMNPKSCNLIQKNILCNKHLNISNIEVENVVLSDEIAIGRKHKIKGFRLDPKDGSGREYELDVKTLDEYCQANNIYPDLIKIDVEGWEAKIVKGAEKILLQYKPTLYVELHSNQLLKQHSMTRLEFIEHIMSLGFSCFYAGKHRVNNSSLPDLDTLEKVTRLTENINREADDVYVFRA